MNKQQDLFDQSGTRFREKNAPLAYRMRPVELSDFVGQEELVGPGKVIANMLQEEQLVSMILWGPPGSGKTSLARIISQKTGYRFVAFSAVISGIKEIKEVIEEARKELGFSQRRTILFIDELHRFNKAQQDAFLPHIEDGTILFIGATTENPSFQVNTPLLSRMSVFILKALTEQDLVKICQRALHDQERGIAFLKPVVSDEVLERICAIADGDARVALNILELAIISTKPAENGLRHIEQEKIKDILQRKVLRYDQQAEEHYNLISAFHKALRGSDPQGAIYWLGRMLEGGEDPLYIARRMVRFASEDVGLADPMALSIAIDAREAYHMLGMPEGALALFQAAVYLATAPRSNALYLAEKKVHDEIQKSGSIPVPLHIRNAPTQLMKDIGYGRDYQYAHNFEDAVDTQDYVPPQTRNKTFYVPKTFGFEKQIKERIEELQRRKNEKRGQDQSPRDQV
ncbi:replication-associated recombination protein A [bacterium]|nr:replication-associated recombination protein A [bacterium]